MRILVLLLIIFLVWSCHQPTESWKIVENDQGVLVLEGTDSVLFYQRAPKSLDGQYTRANYVHPLYGLENNILTEDFPVDHPHHRGVFWAWHQNYIGEESVGDAWALEDFNWEVARMEVSKAPDSCVLRVKVDWQSPLWLQEEGAQKPFVREQTSIKIYSAAKDYRVIDFCIELVALEDSLFIGGSEDEKGYSGFSWRIPLPEGITFTGENGEVKPQNLAVAAGPWIDINGDLDEQAGREGVLVLSHRENPGHPQPWILRKKGSMQNAAFPGREKIGISKDQPLVLEYRMIIYRGTLAGTIPEDVLLDSF